MYRTVFRRILRPAFRWNFRRRLAAVCVCCSLSIVLSPQVFAWESSGFLDSAFHEELAYDYGNARMDMSAVSSGYVAVSAYSENRLKFQVLKDDITYTYDIHSDGTPSVVPLQSGDGEYLFRIMENVTGTKYAIMCQDVCQVYLDDPFQPFLRPNDYAAYTPDSACVKLAGELAAGAGSALEAVSAIYDYICSHVVYDHIKAVTVQSGYLPVPDETLATGMGICFDYASLAASMMRSLGIPAKVIFGFVSPDDLYHAWNMFYTRETGWVTVDYQVSEETWNRLDLTFSANGADGTFIGDGSNYTDMYYY